MKKILNFIRYIFIAYIGLFAIINAFYISQKRIYNNLLPSLFGYSYIKMDDDISRLDINKNDYLFFKDDKNIKENNIIIYRSDDKLYVNKIKQVNDGYYYIENESGEEQTIFANNVLGKLVYTNKTLSKVLNIIYTPLCILLMLAYSIFITNYTYERFKQ